MKKLSLGAMVAAGLFAGSFATTAQAADLGGDCCADLEERIAELEATTARKGNRKVSLTISGFVGQQVLFWDDGVESNVYVQDTGSVSIGSHVAFAGEAKITNGWSAGYRINIELINNDSLLSTQNNDNEGNAFATTQGGNLVSIESSYWFLKSDKYGRLSVGQQSSAADNQAIIVDGSGSLVFANYVIYDVNAFNFRNGAGAQTGVNIGSLAACQTVGGAAAADCDGFPNNSIRYDSPTYAGFGFSASVGEDDIWSASLRYAGTVRDFKLAAAVAYVQNTDENSFNTGSFDFNGNGVFNAGRDVRFQNKDEAHFQVGAYAQHIPTGLFAYGAYGYDDSDSNYDGFTRELGGENYYIKAGIRQRWNPLGHSVLYGEWGQNDDKFGIGLAAQGVTSSELTQYGVGFVQEIDAAAASIFMNWRHYEGDVTCADAAAVGANDCADATLVSGANDLEDFDIFKAGMLINF